jgi:hypothetical protein
MALGCCYQEWREGLASPARSDALVEVQSKLYEIELGDTDSISYLEC